MTPESPRIINDEIIDTAFHDEIKCRAYELYERRHDAADGPDLQGRTTSCGLCGCPDSEEIQWWGMGHQSRQSSPGLPACSDLVCQ